MRNTWDFDYQEINTKNWPLLDKEIDLKVAVNIALSVGPIMYEGFTRGAAATQKSDSSDVTAYDQKIEEMVHAALAIADPESGIIGEELGEAQQGAKLVWVVDPIDGTTNYARGIPLTSFTISKLRRDSDGLLHTLCGVVYNPLSGEFFYAVRGQGAFLNGQRLAPIPDRSLSQSVLCFNPMLPRSGNLQSNEAEIVEAVWNAMKLLTVRSGRYQRKLCNVALELAWVALGRLDAVVSSWTSPWDSAAGTLLVQEVGGVVTDLFGQPWAPSYNGFIAAGTKIHAEALSALKESMAKG